MPKLLCLDPGHGGYDPGAIAIDKSITEKAINIIVCDELKSLLNAQGIKVIMTRDGDSSPGGLTSEGAELQKRCDISNSAKCDYFLSVHVNAGGGRGAEAYCWPGGQGQQLANVLMDAISPTMGVHGEAIKDGGPNGKHLYVICNTKCPAVLLELGFIDSSDLGKLKQHLHDFAKMLAGPLGKFLGGSQSPAPVTPEVSVNIATALEIFKTEFDIKLQALLTIAKGG